MTKFKNLKFDKSIFMDSSNLDEIAKWNKTGVIDGVTTNQYIFTKDKLKANDIKRVLKKICLEMKDKPVSIELTDSSKEADSLIEEARKLSAIAPNVVVKVPLIPNTDKSLWVIHKLIELNIAVNVTLLMTYEQIILAILATRYSRNVSFVSLFWGRTIEDQAKYRSRSDFVARYPKLGMGSWVNSSPKNIVEATMRFLKEGNYINPKLIVGSIRTASMAGEAFASGANIVTVTPEVLETMLFSQRTLETMEQFDNSWKQIHQFQRKKNGKR